MNINTVLTVVSLTIFAIVLAVVYMQSKNQTTKLEVSSFNSIEKVTEAVKNEMVDIVREDFTLGLSDEEFERLYKRKARVNEALKNCVYGIESAKALVIDLIRGFIDDKVPHDKITELLGLTDESEPSSHVKFEIIMYRYKKIYGKDALVKWIDKEDFARERLASDANNKQDKCYFITVDDLNNSYIKENIELTMDEQIDVLAVLVYQQYKGFGIIDTLGEMNINGYNMGTSGSIQSAGKQKVAEYRANNAVWLYDRGRYIHLRFLNYGTEEELRRIIQLLIRWGNPGPLTSKRGYLVNTMHDKSRILALRPPMSEYWAIFVRKFNLSDVSPEALIVKEYTKRGDLAISLIEYLIRGEVTCGVTGRQGSGKTTLMSSIIRYIDPRYTIRVLEMAPELYLRELYPTRNILSIQETATTTADQGQDALKKSDGAISIVGEVATDQIASNMIKMGQVASIFTIFSHHANTAKDLVLALRNSLVNAGGFSNMETAEKQVTDVVRMDIHLDYTPDGKRYIERVSEIVQLEEGIPYPELDINDPNSMDRITREFYERSTDRIGFYTHDILRYDVSTHTYKTHDRFSKVLEDKIIVNLGVELANDFELFMLQEWGPRKDEHGNNILSDEEVKNRIAELQNIISNSDNNRDNEVPTDGVVNSIVEDKLSEAELMYDSDVKSEWASGYNADRHVNEDSEQLGEFDLGTFFDDSDYYN